MIKTYANWKGSLNDYLQIGDQVDEEMYYYFLDVLPPACNRTNLVQMGEPYSISKKGKSTFLTLEKVDGKWIYKGQCHLGDNKHQASAY